MPGRLARPGISFGESCCANKSPFVKQDSSFFETNKQITFCASAGTNSRAMHRLRRAGAKIYPVLRDCLTPATRNAAQIAFGWAREHDQLGMIPADAGRRGPCPQHGTFQPCRETTCGLPGQKQRTRGKNAMTQDELTRWAMENGWQMIAGHPSLTKPSSPKEAIVRMVLKATVVHLEAKKPAGKWEKLSGQTYGKIIPDEETGTPAGLGLETIPGFRMLMQENRDRQVFAKLGRRD
jgi:hypothetical protein